MDIHNTTEELVIAEVNAICDSLGDEEKRGEICICSQCRQDAACYVLNRTIPHYVVSHRGLTRVNQENDQQNRADLTAMVYDAIRRVSHNQRPNFDHSSRPVSSSAGETPSFNIPPIMGQVYNGLNFSPITGITVELLQNGKLAEMKDNNWQNPYNLIPNTGGTFTFWPKPVPADKIDISKSFEFTIKIFSSEFAELNHVISIPVVSELAAPSISLSRTFKLPNLYLFPPGEEKNQYVLN